MPAPAASGVDALHVAAERRQLMQALHPVVQMLGTIVGRHIEVVLHDLTIPERSIVAIANGKVSGRRVGQSILGGPKGDRGFSEARRVLSARGEAVHSIIDGYPTLTRSGARLKSSTVVFRDRAGDPFAALCLNADLGGLEAAHAVLGGLLSATTVEPDVGEEPPQMDLLIAEIIDDAVRRLGKTPDVMRRGDKVQAVKAMMQRGLFLAKGGVERAAAALGVTRFTIYNYLEAVRLQESGDGGSDGARSVVAGAAVAGAGSSGSSASGSTRPKAKRRIR